MVATILGAKTKLYVKLESTTAFWLFYSELTMSLGSKILCKNGFSIFAKYLYSFQKRKNTNHFM